ncbi:major facilitator superfamily domain-containing protein [Podospora didyma]|uniref:Major facilitator superfamily domain-containing protein n=1 Tax=Podospora didyma TaxID=330526 RepID=A0AAE0TZ93_9PEZI|nr:major facilitator superfamily domain-containing protein [Podospora didyma]
MGGVFSKFFRDEQDAAVFIQFNPNDGPRTVLSVLDDPRLDSFKWRVCWVAASGFFTTSYCIFSTNIIAPALNFVYPLKVECNAPISQPFILNLTTLAGTAVGMIAFGCLADRNGRKKLYGLELFIVIAATIGLTQSSTGYHSMDIYGWIGFWRFVLGVGLGAEYPLSATIAAEWSSTRTRGRMMATVFLMQSIGQVVAYGVSLAVLAGLGPRLGLLKETTDPEVAKQAVDAIWRVVIGVGAFPALVAIFLRRLLPETPRWLVEHISVQDAIDEAGPIYGADPRPLLAEPADPPPDHENLQANHEEHRDSVSEKPANGLWARIVVRRWDNLVQPIRSMDVYQHLREKDWVRLKCLAGISVAWFLLDLAVYGLGLDSPRTISTMYLSSPPPDQPCSETWRADPAQPNITIYSMLEQDTVRNLQTITTGTLPGSLIVLLFIDYIPRATWMGWLFVALGGLFAITGGTFYVAYESDKHAMTLVFYVLTQLLLNLGPNTMTWIMPAELFGTRYRATFYGIAAAAGKLGALAIQVINTTSVAGKGRDPFAGMLLGLCPAMFLGALVTWLWIPEVQLPRRGSHHVQAYSEGSDNNSQHHRGSRPGTPTSHSSAASLSVQNDRETFLARLILLNRSLEDIADDPAGNQIFGWRAHCRWLFGDKRANNGGSRNMEHETDATIHVPPVHEGVGADQ